MVIKKKKFWALGTKNIAAVGVLGVLKGDDVIIN